MPELLSKDFQTLIEGASDLVMIAQDARVLYANPAAHAALGYAAGELHGRLALELAHADDREQIRERIARASGGKRNSPTTFRLLRKDGGAVRISSTSFHMEIEGRPAAVLMGRDLSEREQAFEQRLLLETVLQFAPVAIISLDQDRQVTHWNRAAEQMWLWPPHAPGAQPPMAPENRKLMLDLCELAAARGETINHSTPLKRAADNRVGEVHASVAPLRDAQDRPNGFVFVIDDLAERRMLEKQAAGLRDSLRRAEALSAMGSLIAGVAHEVRNPLFGMTAALDVIEARGGPPDRFLQMLRGELERLNRLMRDLLDYGKPPEPALAIEPIEPVLRAAVQACKPVSGDAGIPIVEAFARDLPPFSLDAGRLTQAVQNLLQNAIQHSPKSGSVRLEAQAVGNHIEVRVLDQGHGIRPDDLPRLFEPFFTRRRGGTGLGLAIVQRIIEQHGGTVQIKNRSEGGTEARVLLPIAATVSARQ